MELTKSLRNEDGVLERLLMLDYTPKSTTNYSKLLTLLIRVGGVFRHLAISSSWLEPVLFDIILTSSSSLHSPPLEKDVVLNMNG